MTIFNIVTGLAAMLTVSILGTVDPTTADQLKNAFLFLPNYCFGQALSDMYTKSVKGTGVILEETWIMQLFRMHRSLDRHHPMEVNTFPFLKFCSSQLSEPASGRADAAAVRRSPGQGQRHCFRMLPPRRDHLRRQPALRAHLRN